MKSPRPRHPALSAAVVAALAAVPAVAQDVSAPAILQQFESTHANTEARAADAWVAGYGSVWVPPPGRADSGGFSVGYDQYDRFDLGTWDHKTLYGTERGTRRMNDAWHRFGGRVYADLVWNHNGFSDLATPGFVDSGDYPGFALDLDAAVDGDFHSSFAGGVIEGRLSGLIDIDHETNFRFVRNPVTPGDPRNLPAGTAPAYGRLADVPDAANRRFYPSQGGPGRTLYDPATNETFTVHDFRGDGSEILDGAPVEENALGYLMRNAQWYVQDVGFDGFRLDAVKHMEPWVLNYLDRAVHDANPRLRLDGSRDPVFSFGEALDGDVNLLQQYVRKDIDPSQPGVVGGNRDVLDFPLHFALKANLSNNGLQNDWRNVVDASFDRNDDGMANNGGQGVAFDASHDDAGADLGNVAAAYLAMRPGNWVVYHNAEQFGTNRDFPKDGRGDALGGLYGEAVTTLVGLRNTHGRGDYRERWLDKETLVYEREGSAVVALSNRGDGGFDTRTVQTGFAPGTRLVDATGTGLDETVAVDADGRATVRVPRNGDTGGNGYIVYALPTPQGEVTIGGVSQVLPGGTPTAATNGTTRLADYGVVTGDAFTVTLQTQPVTLADGYRDFDADGDAALLKLNGGLDVNGSGAVDVTAPGDVAYGFEAFAGKSSPLALGGDGEFVQQVDATGLPEGVNFVEVRAFRRRTDGGPAVYTPFKEVVYVDRLPPESAVSEVNALGDDARQFVVESVDGTADSVHAFLNLPVDADPLAMVNFSNKAGQVDRDLFAYGFDGLVSGNHALTVVTYEPTGNVNVQRFAGFAFDTGVGLGAGDVDHDGDFDADDVFGTGAFEQVLYAAGGLFDPAADVTGDGVIDSFDLFLLEPIYRDAGASAAAAEARQAEVRRGNLNGDGGTDAADIDHLFAALSGGAFGWAEDLFSDGVAARNDVETLVGDVFNTAFADATLDGVVGHADLALLQSNYGGPGGWAAGDFNGDLVVDRLDALILQANWGFDRNRGQSPDPSAFPAAHLTVPEPAAAAGLGLAALAALRRPRRSLWS